MPRPGFVDRHDLKGWADTVSARSDLPRLVRKLVLETTPTAEHIAFAAVEGVATGGFDGTVRALESTPWVPAGLSLWELSVDSSTGRKADKDYEKRISTPDGSSTTDAVYVQLSLRPWTKRAEWAKQNRQDGRWHDVIAYGLDDVHAWLEAAPVTWAWLSEEMGRHPRGLRSAETWWSAWSSQTSPAATTDLVLAGRASARDELLARLDQGPAITTVHGPSIDEARAFVTAVAAAADQQGRGDVLARMAFVDEIAAWRELLESSPPLILVPATPDLAKEVPGTSPHHVIVPVPHENADVSLPSIDVTEAKNALTDAGIDDQQADEYARLARRSLTAMRRRIAVSPALHTPPWAETPVERQLRAALIAGRWSDDNAEDRAILSDVAGEDYERLRETLAHHERQDDPFVAQVGSSWEVVSHQDAWLLLAAQVTTDDLQRLRDTINRVLGETDPALELPRDQRWRAQLDGEVLKHSSQLRRGLANTLALLATAGSSIRAPSGTTGQGWASLLVHELLADANDDASGHVWASLADLLPTLAEAAPDRFIDALREGLAGDEPLLATMFTDKQDGGIFGPSSPHTGLLWALETLAWSPEHFGAAVDLLSRFDNIDPGGRLSNRPFNSLAEIFCPWHPETAASPSQRLQAIDALRDRHQDCAWRLIMAMLPEFHGSHSPTRAPRYRDWKPPRQPVTNVEYFRFTSELVTRAIEDASEDAGQWAELIDKVVHVLPEDWDRVVDALDGLATRDVFDADAAAALWEALRGLIATHRDFQTAEWALSTAALNRLEEVADKVRPRDPLSRAHGLFTEHMPDLGTGTKLDDHKAYEEELADRRRDAVVEIVEEAGMEGVMQLAQESAVAWSVGRALADGLRAEVESDLLPLLAGDPASAEVEVAHAYFARRFQLEGWAWARTLIERQELGPVVKARLLWATRDLPEAWEVAEELGDEVRDEYWRRFQPYGLGRDFPHVEVAVQRLLSVDRHAAALRLADLYARRSTDEERPELARLVAQSLEGLLTTDLATAEVHQFATHDFQNFIELLEAERDSLGTDRVARLEWAFLPALGFEPRVPSLHAHLANDPAFFAEVVATVYKPAGAVANEDQADDVMTEESAADTDKARLATNAYRLLSSWRQPPGLQSDGTLDGDALVAWVNEARRLLDDADRAGIGDDIIGNMLVSVPARGDEPWPPRVVRELLEEIQSRELEIGIETEIYNRRGVTSRGLEEGGQQEVDLAVKYREAADRYADAWPRTARVLRRVAESFADDARRNEEQAERFRRGMDL